MVKDWDKATIGDFLDFKNGLNKGKEYFGHGTPIINYTDVYNHRGLYKSDIKGLVELQPNEISRYEVKKGDVFFTRTSETPDEVGITSVLLDNIRDCVFSGFVLRGRPKNAMLLAEYCKYCFSTAEIRNKIVSSCTYTTRALTNGTQLSKIEIPIPPEPEQARIAEALSDIDNLICTLQKLIEKKKAMKVGVLTSLVNGITRLPGHNDEWERIRISDAGLFIGGSTFPTVEQGRSYGKYPFYKVSDMNNAGNENKMDKANNYISSETAERLKCAIIKPNSIIMAKIGAAIMLERKRLATTECCIDNNMMAFEVNPKYSPEYIWRVFQTIAFSAYAEITALPSLNPKILGNCEISVPRDKDKQEEIALVIEDIDNNLKELQIKLHKYKLVRQGMMEELLTGKVRLV